MGQAFVDTAPSVVLIDEIDKADLEFQTTSYTNSTRWPLVSLRRVTTPATVRPLVIITSNNEKELPDAFLRRCIFHFIAFPDESLMADIVRVHHPKVEQTLIDEAIARFYWLRTLPDLRKAPSTSELIDWISLVKGGIEVEALTERVPYLGSLLKKEQDLETLKRFKDQDGIERDG